ncbi:MULTISPECIES: HAD family hydrolase [unclassified Lysinibacillus]|uniref:HAD family hydrolase n=1 Tax=unclassified Lysinibacillus TaxID=2636778 RepID=UPI003804BBEE
MKYIIFDLDETIFNHTNGEKNGLKDIHIKYFEVYGISYENFHHNFSEFNKLSWENFENGIQNIEATLSNRFKLLCEFYEIEIDLLNLLKDYTASYIRNCIPYIGAKALLNELLNMGFVLGVCSNGLERIQFDKMKYHNIEKYFSFFQFGSEFPSCKPNQYFFTHMLNDLKVEPQEILLIGDSLTNDIIPAEKSGMKTLHINEEYLIGGELQCTLILNKLEEMIVLS